MNQTGLHKTRIEADSDSAVRCSQCVLTNRVPGSDFDEHGVCKWCRTGYPNYRPAGVEPLRQMLEAGKRPDSEADCIVAISGGKDSSFAVWTMKKYFGLRVEAFTYDHDGVTPHARENARAVCRALGVPLHVFSLAGHAHLKSFQDYFAAWLQKPSAVTAGLTCVACKHLHLFGTELAVSRRAPFVVWAKCPLEDSPFLALKHREGTKREGLWKGSALLAAETIQSPPLVRALSRHLSLTLKGCLAFTPGSAYLNWRYPSVEQVSLFDYWPWNPEEIYNVLSSFGWNKPREIPNDWHSDCVFNVFKEYFFQSMLGVSYTDGFLSNQIRSGLLSREQALKELAESKRYFASALQGALEKAGCARWLDAIDSSCFTFKE